VGSDAVGASYQGHHVALSADGNTAIVGGYRDNSNKGAAWIFTRSGGVWSQQGSKLVGTGAVGGAAQGTSVALSADGNMAIVGGMWDNSNKGAAWVFTRSDGVWTQQGSKLVGSGAVGASQQGRVALSADGTTAMVGGQTDNSSAGAVWVFVNPSQTLTVTRDGTGTGTVSSSPAGIDCGSTCSADFSCGQTVTLSAVAGIGSTFAGWSGEGCSGTGTCQVTMDQARNVTATFTLDTYVLSVSRAGTGSGTVTSSPAGIDCGSDCSESYTSGTVVTLSAVADTGSTFAGWAGGGCSGSGTCQVTIDVATSVTATFNLASGGCDVVLQSQTISTNTLQESCGTIKAGPALAVQSPAQLTLRAATYVVLRNGFSVGSGAKLTVALDPSLGGS